MTGSSVDPGGWVYRALRSVRAATLEVDDPDAFAGKLAEAVADEGPHSLVWVGRITGADELWVAGAATPAGRIETGSLLSADVGGAGRRAVETDTVQTSAAVAADPEYGVLAEHVESEPTGSLSVPVGDERVLVLYTTEAVDDPRVREMARDLGETAMLGYRHLETRQELARERERLETVRSVVSHDLGNPLNVASGRLSLAASECDSEHLEHVERGLDQIEALADETLRFVEASRPVETYERVSLAEFARSCWSNVEAGRGTLNVTELTIAGDRVRIRTLLTELFENARLHSDRSVTVTVEPLADRPGFAVADDGPGIDSSTREYVFDRGYSTTPDRNGDGLALVEAIVDAHDWALELDTGPEGTRIEIATDRW